MAENDLNSSAFPRLDEEQMACLARCPLAALKRYEDGQKLIEAGDRDFKFFVVKFGRIEILDESRDEAGDAARPVAALGPGEFTGEVSQLTGEPSPVSAAARGGCEAYEVTSEALRQIINQHPGLGDVILQTFLARRQLLRERGTFTGLRVIGSKYSKDTFRVREFLARNRAPFIWLDLEADPRVKQLLERFGVSEAQTPVVAWGRKLVLRNPSNRELAEALGLREPVVERTVYDLVVVGAGPAGLAAAVYAASEGLNTLVLERTAPGGQAGRSMRIENYLGFPTGITGSDLAERAALQARKFGAHMPVTTQAVALTFDTAYPVLEIDGGEKVTAKCLLIATGADYRMLDVEGCREFEGRGVYYAATPTEALACKGSDAVVVGGGNSAGQAAVYLATQVRKVYLVVRGDSLYKDMSSYLARRIEQNPRIEVLLDTEVRRMGGDGRLNRVEVVNNKSGEVGKLEAPALFGFIGATPRSDWLPPAIERDAKRFVRTGPAVARHAHRAAAREPFLLETSRAGVFASGDVRSGSTKRVASAVGEGAMAVQFVHGYLRRM